MEILAIIKQTIFINHLNKLKEQITYQILKFLKITHIIKILIKINKKLMITKKIQKKILIVNIQ